MKNNEPLLRLTENEEEHALMLLIAYEEARLSKTVYKLNEKVLEYIAAHPEYYGQRTRQSASYHLTKEHHNTGRSLASKRARVLNYAKFQATASAGHMRRQAYLVSSMIYDHDLTSIQRYDLSEISRGLRTATIALDETIVRMNSFYVHVKKRNHASGF